MDIKTITSRQELSFKEQKHLRKTFKIINDLTRHCSEHVNHTFDDETFDRIKSELDNISLRYIIEIYDLVETYYQLEITNYEILNTLDQFYKDVKKEIYSDS